MTFEVRPTGASSLRRGEDPVKAIPIFRSRLLQSLKQGVFKRGEAPLRKINSPFPLGRGTQGDGGF